MENDELTKKDENIGQHDDDFYETERRRRLARQREYEQDEMERRRKMCRFPSFVISVVSVLLMYWLYRKEDFEWHQISLRGEIGKSLLIIVLLVGLIAVMYLSWNNKTVFLIYMIIRLSIACLVILWLLIMSFFVGIFIAIPIFFIWVFPVINYLNNYRE